MHEDFRFSATCAFSLARPPIYGFIEFWSVAAFLRAPDPKDDDDDRMWISSWQIHSQLPQRMEYHHHNNNNNTDDVRMRKIVKIENWIARTNTVWSELKN